MKKICSLNIITVVRCPSSDLELTANSVETAASFSDQIFWTVIVKNLDSATVNLLGKVAEKLGERFQFREQRGDGIYSAMNEALQIVRGDSFIFLNSGDTVVPHAIALVSDMDATRVTCFRSAWHDSNGTLLRQSTSHPPRLLQFLGAMHNHQGMVFPSSFTSRQYSERLRISADLELKIQLKGGGFLRESKDQISSCLVGGVSASSLTLRESVERWRDQVEIYFIHFSPLRATILGIIWFPYFLSRWIAR